MASKRPSNVRLFFALDLPPEARAEIAAWREPLLDGLRPVAQDALHVTLVFLGWLGEEEVPRLAAAASEAVAGRHAVSLAPVGLQAVPPRSPRLFALDLDDRGGRCASLQSSLHASVIGATYGAQSQKRREEKRPFWPHVTLARVKRPRRATPPRVSGLPGAFVADRVVLYRSVPGRQGSQYEPLWAATLDP